MKSSLVSTVSRFALAIAGAAFLSAAASAAPIPTSFSDTDLATKNTTGLTNFATHGDEMDGLTVTVSFLGGGSETAVWATTGVDAGAASGTGWSISLTGDTFVSRWFLTNVSAREIVGFTMDGVPGQTVFDIIDAPETSPDSAAGRGFSDGDVTGPGPTAAVGRYSDGVAINGIFYDPDSATDKDLYTTLTVAFTGSLAAGGTFSFLADTDNAITAITEIPTPAALALFGLGLAGLGVAVRRKG